MVDRPERHVAAFAEAGADGITCHVEATPHIHYALQAVRDAGCRSGVALNPGTPAEAVAALAGDADLVLAMTVNPGWGGQPFIDASPAKLRRLCELHPDAVIEVDGGIGPDTAAPVRGGRRDAVRRRFGGLRQGRSRRRPPHYRVEDRGKSELSTRG